MTGRHRPFRRRYLRRRHAACRRRAAGRRTDARRSSPDDDDPAGRDASIWTAASWRRLCRSAGQWRRRRDVQRRADGGGRGAHRRGPRAAGHAGPAADADHRHAPRRRTPRSTPPSRPCAAGVPGIAGLHLEGPHLSVARKGAHDPPLIRPLEDDDLDLLVAAARRLPALMVTVAPESVTPDRADRRRWRARRRARLARPHRCRFDETCAAYRRPARAASRISSTR